MQHCSLREWMSALEEVAPCSLAEPWDNVGLLCGDPAQTIARVLICNDWDERVLAEAYRLSAAQSHSPAALTEMLILAYHPPWFRPCKTLVGPSPLYAAVRGGAAIYSLHTAFDAAEQGPNAALARILRLFDAAPLVPACAPHPAYLGQGRVGALAKPEPLSAFVARLKRALRVPGVLLAPSGRDLAAEAPVRRVAVAAGAGRSLLVAARKAKADVLVTGELPHHDALAARSHGIRVVMLRHSVSERLALPPLAASLQARFAGIPVSCSLADADPYILG